MRIYFYLINTRNAWLFRYSSTFLDKSVLHSGPIKSIRVSLCHLFRLLWTGGGSSISFTQKSHQTCSMGASLSMWCDVLPRSMQPGKSINPDLALQCAAQQQSHTELRTRYHLWSGSFILDWVLRSCFMGKNRKPGHTTFSHSSCDDGILIRKWEQGIKLPKIKMAAFDTLLLTAWKLH